MGGGVSAGGLRDREVFVDELKVRRVLVSGPKVRGTLVGELKFLEEQLKVRIPQ